MGSTVQSTPSSRAGSDVVGGTAGFTVDEGLADEGLALEGADVGCVDPLVVGAGVLRPGHGAVDEAPAAFAPGSGEGAGVAVPQPAMTPSVMRVARHHRGARLMTPVCDAARPVAARIPRRTVTP